MTEMINKPLQKRTLPRPLKRFLRNPLSIFGGLVVALVVLCAVFAPWLAPYPEDAGPSVHFEVMLQAPNLAHPFGTDEVGRDILSRSMFGARTSLTLAAVVLTISLIIGIPLGLISGYSRGWLSDLIGRITDIFLAVPALVLALAVTVAFTPSLLTSMIAVSFTWWPWYTRLVHGEAVRLREEPYVEAAQALGLRHWLIPFKHILPNLISPVIVKVTLDVGFVILLGASLAFLGIGAQEPLPDWGAMVARGRGYLPTQWWISTMPGLVILLTVMGFNLMGDGLRDSLDVVE